VRITIFKIKPGKKEKLLQWGAEIMNNQQQALLSIGEENCREESMRIFSIENNDFLLCVMSAKDKKGILPYDKNQPINKKHFEILEECLEGEVSQEKMYHLRL